MSCVVFQLPTYPRCISLSLIGPSVIRLIFRKSFKKVPLDFSTMKKPALTFCRCNSLLNRFFPGFPGLAPGTPFIVFHEGLGFGGFSGAFPPIASTGNVVVHNAFHFAGMAGAAAAGWGLVAPSSPIMAASQPLAPSLTSAVSFDTASSAAVAVAPLTPSVAAHRDEIPSIPACKHRGFVFHRPLS